MTEKDVLLTTKNPHVFVVSISKILEKKHSSPHTGKLPCDSSKEIASLVVMRREINEPSLVNHSQVSHEDLGGVQDLGVHDARRALGQLVQHRRGVYLQLDVAADRPVLARVVHADGVGKVPRGYALQNLLRVPFGGHDRD